MFGSNIRSQRNSSIHSQSSYEGSFHPSLFESYNRVQNNFYPFQNSNNANENPQSNILSQNPLIFSQFSNNNSIGGRKGTQQSFASSNFINYKQFENIFIENIKNFPAQVNDYLTKEEENINLKLLMNSLNNTSSITCQNINKINDNYCSKLSNSNCNVPKLFELCSKINEILNSIDNELINQFSLLTSFHGYDESVQNDEKMNLNKIKDVINECNQLLVEKIIKINDSSINFNNEMIINCQQFNNMLEEEMKQLSINLNELIKCKNENNNNYEKYQQITDYIINSINSLKNKFIFSKSNGNENENKIITDNEINNEIKNMDNNLNNNNIDENTKIKNRLATLKIISEMQKRNKKRKKKNKNFK
jgi:hypothetical protein